MIRCGICDGLFDAAGPSDDWGHNTAKCSTEHPKRMRKRVADLEAAVLAAKTLLSPTNDETEAAWQVLDDAHHGGNSSSE
jgi:hypothetical protein